MASTLSARPVVFGKLSVAATGTSASKTMCMWTLRLQMVHLLTLRAVRYVNEL